MQFTNQLHIDAINRALQEHQKKSSCLRLPNRYYSMIIGHAEKEGIIKVGQADSGRWYVELIPISLNLAGFLGPLEQQKMVTTRVWCEHWNELMKEILTHSD